MFLFAKAPYWNGANQRRRGGGGEREIFFALPLPPFLLSFSHLLKGILFLLSPIFLCHKIKDGGYNNTNINKLSPTQNTPALQAISFKKLACLQLLVKGYLKQTFWQRRRAWTIDSAGDWRVTLTWAGGWLWISSTAFSAAPHPSCESERKLRQPAVGHLLIIRWDFSVMLCYVMCAFKSLY